MRYPLPEQVRCALMIHIVVIEVIALGSVNVADGAHALFTSRHGVVPAELGS